MATFFVTSQLIITVEYHRGKLVGNSWETRENHMIGLRIEREVSLRLIAEVILHSGESRDILK